MQVKKELSILLIFMMLAALLSGCTDATTITINEDYSGSYSETATLSKRLWDLSIGASYDENSLADLYRSLYPGAEVAIEDTVIDQVASKEIQLRKDFKNESEFQQLMNNFGLASVKFNQNYFSRSAIATASSDSSATDVLPDDMEGLFEGNEQLMPVILEELQNINIKLTVSFPYQIEETNGAVQADGKTVVWEMTQLTDGEGRYYATFCKQDSSKAPVILGAKNKKQYNSGVTLTVDSENLIDYIDVNGKAIHSDYLSLTEEGLYQITVFDLNQNKSSLSFRIDMTKPIIKGVKNGKTYYSAQTVRFLDAGSGVRKATLNNKKISSGTKITKKGSYTLRVIDKAGNKKTVKFKIK